MKKMLKSFIAFLICISLFSCKTVLKPTLKPVSITKKESLGNFKYVYITPTESIKSETGASINGQYYSSGKTINPGDLISGILTKKGFVKIPALNANLLSETLIVNYGESGRRKTGLGGYTIEITLQFVNAKSNVLVSSCTAEGQGATEADDIRIAISRCINELPL